jgi:branched-chain amino acid transport system ATP-binding protein
MRSPGLAPIIVDEIFDFLARLAAEGHSLLIVEQYVASLALANLVSLLVRGRPVFVGEPAELQDTDIFARYLGAEAGKVLA